MQTANMKEQIKMLIELQALDSEMFGYKRVLEDIPARLKAMDDELEAKSITLKTVEEEFKKIQLLHKEKEGELAAKEEGIKKNKAQLFQLKTNQEYAAKEKEIAGLRADSSVLEEDIIGLFDKIDDAKKMVEKEKEAFESERKIIAGEKKKIEEDKKASETRYGELNAKRNAFAGKIDKNTLAVYERILHNKDGLAIVPVIGGMSCGGCNMNLPPQVVNEAKMGKKLIFCGNCARILYSE